MSQDAKPITMTQNETPLPVTEIQFREASNRFVESLELSIIPRIGETVHIQGDHARQVLNIIHAYDPNAHIIICVVSE